MTDTTRTTEATVILSLMADYGLGFKQLANLMDIGREEWMRVAIEAGTLSAKQIADAFVCDCLNEGDLECYDESDEDIEVADDAADDDLTFDPFDARSTLHRLPGDEQPSNNDHGWNRPGYDNEGDPEDLFAE
jgi:hypothetical protein